MSDFVAESAVVRSLSGQKQSTILLQSGNDGEGEHGPAVGLRALAGKKFAITRTFDWNRAGQQKMQNHLEKAGRQALG